MVTHLYLSDENQLSDRMDDNNLTTSLSRNKLTLHKQSGEELTSSPHLNHLVTRCASESQVWPDCHHDITVTCPGLRYLVLHSSCMCLHLCVQVVTANHNNPSHSVPPQRAGCCELNHRALGVHWHPFPSAQSWEQAADPQMDKSASTLFIRY